ncbi:MAG TPA: M28 family peptidase [Thermoleophilaceae bacterium]|nr:M28 family peptidase [Thermoleophilaceae bacterium]
MKLTSAALAAATAAVLLPAAAIATHETQIAPDVTKLDYAPNGHFAQGTPLPPANAYRTAIAPHVDENGIFNPSGNFNAFDNNIFEVLAYPYRGAGDEFADDPPGNGANGGDPDHGQCSGDPRSDRVRYGTSGYPEITGECFNHQIEYVEYYERTMKHILGDLGVTFRRYEFWNPTQGPTDPTAPFGPPLLSTNTFGGRSINPAAIIPGAEHPEETVVIGAHYDKTLDGPAAAWDSQEGHAQMIRVAKLLADYYRETGTRPSATIKLIPWDGEESGTLGSLDYTTNVIPPGDEEFKVRGYFNTDPCSGAYPAFRYGDPADRVGLGIQLANPRRQEDDLEPVLSEVFIRDAPLPQKYHARMDAFNGKARGWVEEIFEALDDTLTVGGRPVNIFVASSETPTAPYPTDIGEEPGQSVHIGTARDVLFSSDWLHFENRGIPFFNPGPEVTGPSTQGDPVTPDAVVILHSPFDNLQELNRYTGAPGGNTMSEGWIKGMEMCSHLLAGGMIQSDQAGAIEAGTRVVPYFEALPNEAALEEPVHFDAGGSHQVTGGDLDSDAPLTYAWDFGDGTSATGRSVYHRYSATRAEPYPATLTVTNTDTGQTGTMSVPITVVPDPTEPLPVPELDALPAQDADGTFDLEFRVRNHPSNVTAFEIMEASDYTQLLFDDAEGAIGDKWAVTAPTHREIEPWQASDSSTRKFRPSASASGRRSWWTGVQPQNFPVGAFAGGTNVGEHIEGESAMTMKDPVTLPEGGGPSLTFNYVFKSEGDDEGRIEVMSLDDPDAGWQRVDVIKAVNTALGDSDPHVCDPSQEGTLLDGFRQRSVDLAEFQGQRILVRFVYVSGPQNRSVSQPCGWYLDDVEVATARFAPVAEADEIGLEGQNVGGTYTVSGRCAGRYAYRVRALYPPGDHGGPASAATTTTVTGPPCAGPDPDPDPDPGPDPDPDPAPTGGGTGDPAPTRGGNPTGGPLAPLAPIDATPVAAISTGGSVTPIAGRDIPVKVACAATNADCRGTLTLYALTSGPRASGRVKLGAKRFRVAPGRTSTVRVRVTTKRRKLLVRKALRVQAVAVTRHASGEIASTTRRTFKLNQRKTRRRR